MSSESGLTDPLETTLVHNDKEEQSEEAEEYVKLMDSFQSNKRKYYEPLGENTQTLVPSIERPPQLEKKPLPSHLRYPYIGESSTLQVIISVTLTAVEEEKILRVLRDHKDAFGWSLADLNGIRPSMCMHQILLEDGHKPLVEAQRRLNPIMKEVVGKEVLKWLDARVIYPIPDSSWVSPVQVVPKKEGTIMIRTENNALVTQRFPVRPDWRIRTGFGVRNHILGLFTFFFFFQSLTYTRGYTNNFCNNQKSFTYTKELPPEWYPLKSLHIC